MPGAIVLNSDDVNYGVASRSVEVPSRPSTMGVR